MRRFFLILLGLIGLAVFATLPAGCPADDDDDSGMDDDDDAAGSALCSGPGCMNSGECPPAEPDAGDPCTFNGNCHYCPDGSDEAEGYTCNGTSFTYQGTYTCNP